MKSIEKCEFSDVPALCDLRRVARLLVCSLRQCWAILSSDCCSFRSLPDDGEIRPHPQLAIQVNGIIRCNLTRLGVATQASLISPSRPPEHPISCLPGIHRENWSEKRRSLCHGEPYCLDYAVFSCHAAKSTCLHVGNALCRLSKFHRRMADALGKDGVFSSFFSLCKWWGVGGA